MKKQWLFSLIVLLMVGMASEALQEYEAMLRDVEDREQELAACGQREIRARVRAIVDPAEHPSDQLGQGRQDILAAGERAVGVAHGLFAAEVDQAHADAQLVVLAAHGSGQGQGCPGCGPQLG